MIEYWDLLDGRRRPTGDTVLRGGEFPAGYYHTVVHVCLFGGDGRMLIQKRQSFKQGWPGMWDITVGGSALAGEDSQTAAARELSEEVGIDADLSGDAPCITLNEGNVFDDYYIISRGGDGINPDTLRLQASEVERAAWASEEEILAMIDRGEFIPYHKSLIAFLFALSRRRGCHFREER